MRVSSYLLNKMYVVGDEDSMSSSSFESHGPSHGVIQRLGYELRLTE